VGLVLLGQVPSVLSVLGIGFVVAAGIGAERSGARADAPVATLPECPPVTTPA
jgi:inner membrane transporter RhtA